MNEPRHLLAASLVRWLCAFTAVAGCAHSKPSVVEPQQTAVPREILTAFQCEIADPDDEGAEQREHERRVAALRLDFAFDHIRFIHHGSDTDQYTFAEQGQACATATDHAACSAKLAELEALGHAKNQVFAIAIQRDALSLYQGREVISLLGPIDNADKAWLVVMVDQLTAPYSCNEPDWNGYRPVPGGYDFAHVWTERNCRPFQRIQAIDHVDHAGNVTRLRTHIVEHDPDACIIDERPLQEAKRRRAETPPTSTEPRPGFSHIR